MSRAGVIEILVGIVGDALSPLAEQLQDEQVEQLLDRLGMRLPPALLSSGTIPQRIQQATAVVLQLPEAVEDLATTIADDDDGGMLGAALQLGLLIGEAGAAFSQLGTSIDTAIQGSADLTAPQKARLGDAAKQLPERFMHLALISWVDENQPNLKGALTLVGLFDDESVAGDPTDPSLPPFRMQRVRFDRIAPLLSDPAQHLSDLYGFGEPSFDGLELFTRLKLMLDRPDAETLLITAPGQPPILEAFLFRMAIALGAIPGLRSRLRLPAEKSIEVATPMGGPWSVTASSSSRFEGGIEFLLHPQDGLRIEPPNADASVDAAFGLQAENSDGSPMILLGQVDGSRLEFQRFSTRMPLRLSTTSGAASPNVALGAELELQDGKIVIDASQADGFITKILGDVGIESDFDLTAFYNVENGLHFSGSATLEIAIPAHLELGPLTVASVYLIGGFDGNAIPLEFSTALGVQLGPLSASVERLGAKGTILFPPEGGNAGISQINIGFKPPNGVGLSVDAGAVKGGGYLYIDPERGEYAGALELSFLEFLTLTAIAIITTKMPDGSKGFSLIAIINVQFNPGMQLGFGFTLLGVGGLLGLNRTMDLDAMVEGVRTGSLESVLFPNDVVANAARIISDLRAFFPPEEGTFLIGPMAKFGWGTPTLISLALGIIIEIPGNIAIVGTLKLALPDERAALVIIQVAFIGAIEFDKKRVWFFATLYESRVLYMPLEGGMGVLAAFGNNPNFVVTVGGFHPAYNPPSLPFTSIARIAINLLSTPVAKVRIDAYFAVTSNTVQFGALAEMFFGIKVGKFKIGIEGHIAFDALFQFSPFYFIIEISASLSVTVFNKGLFSVSFRGSLEGTSPWHVEGTGSLSILWWDLKLDFSRTWGEEENTSLPPISVMPILAQEFEKLDNWTAQPGSFNNFLVSLRNLDEPGLLILHPVGSLTVVQRAIPLDITLDKWGNQRPDDANRFTITSTTAGLELRDKKFESFAIGQFQDLDDGSKLSASDYENEEAGLELAVAGSQLDSSYATKRVVRYEQVIIDNNFRRLVFLFVPLYAGLFLHFLNNNVISQSTLSVKSKNQMQPFGDKIAVQPNSYVVANVMNNQAVAGAPPQFDSRASATEFLKAEIARDPNLAGQYHIIRPHEMAEVT